jgi:hypothetical protein
METNLPATSEASHDEAEERLPVAADRPWTVALLPLGLVVFVILAFVIAAWTFFAAAV